MTTARDMGATAVPVGGPGAPSDGSAAAVEVISVAVHELREEGDEALEVRPLEVHELRAGVHERSILRLVPAPPPDPEPEPAFEREAVPEACVEPGVEAQYEAQYEVACGAAADDESDAEGASGPIWPFRTSALRVRLASTLAAEAAVAVAAGADAEPAAALEAEAALGAVVVPARVAAPGWRPSERVGRADAVQEVSAGRRSRSGRPALPWLRRRWWVAALMLVAGMAGGYTMTKGHVGTYSSQVLLEVRSGSTPANPGGAQEASALAVTYAALVPSDTAVTSAVAARLGVSPATVGAGLSATAESGTGLFLVTYTAPTAVQAIAGANEAGTILASAAPPGLAIVERSVAVVKVASTAKHSKDMRLYGEVGGAVGGLLLGLIFLLVLERVDARVDDPEDAAESCGCPATRWPDGMSARELAVALARQAPEEGLTVVPTSRAAGKPAGRLGALLAGSWPDGAGAEPVSVVAPFEESPEALSDGSGPTILAVTAGEPVRALSEACARLRLLGRAPLFVVLCARS